MAQLTLLGARCVAAVTGLKLLLAPAYRSTDFEVHRNWLAVASQTPIQRWYEEDTSEWTLDYPPTFAWFEWLLAQAARAVDPAMLKVEANHSPSPATVLFQRISVIASDAVLIFGLLFATRKCGVKHQLVALLLVLLNPGLLLVDHIHFQYNGMLLGLLVWSLALMAEGQDLAGAIVFTVLVTMKHLFACLGPLYAVYLLRHYCRGDRAVSKFMLLAASVSAVVAASFGPFIVHGQLKQVLWRLFPFGRGLLHAFWAPNFWALYAALDQFLRALLPRLGLVLPHAASSITGGLVGSSSFSVLPNITPAMTLISVFLGMTPCLIQTWRQPAPGAFPFAAVHACLTSFLLGFHVHEKAILMATVPLGWLAASSYMTFEDAYVPSENADRDLHTAAVGAGPVRRQLLRSASEMQDETSAGRGSGKDHESTTSASAGLSRKAEAWHQSATVDTGTSRGEASQLMEYCVLSTAGHYALLPLIFTLQEYPIKVLLLLVSTIGIGALTGDDDAQQQAGRRQASKTVAIAKLYLLGFAVVEGYCAVLHFLIFGEQLPFVPLMLRSVYSAMGVTAVWIRWTTRFFHQSSSKTKHV
ncbi:hypothetical protein WJX74_008396 [Apatococcus lobatus]|uniref:Alpha-1,3-glucosyltransferase n=1 Tax=Apatococcus lobatus TaxID=904363 RepID=A0AAW1SGY4_9CHLO